ncbi:hypothetical protein E2C01_066097 [Portunus trituberculatus]|uniref:Uncharacterized protein n=1 Tax=Portunus trituberculatus TaxID=210409 RepID=A0A5B7HRD7_PORTR|nr:hypothetical protein [Portunus trituberculatus]
MTVTSKAQHTASGSDHFLLAAPEESIGVENVRCIASVAPVPHQAKAAPPPLKLVPLFLLRNDQDAESPHRQTVPYSLNAVEVVEASRTTQRYLHGQYATSLIILSKKRK